MRCMGNIAKKKFAVVAGCSPWRAYDEQNFWTPSPLNLKLLNYFYE